MIWTSCFGSADLMVRQGIADIFHQAINLSCVLGVLEELREIRLGHRRGRHRVHNPTNL